MSQTHHECKLEQHIVEQLQAADWLIGNSEHYDLARALYPEDVLAWLKESQPEVWDRLHGANTETALLDALRKALDSKDGGTVAVLRRGFSLAGGGPSQVGAGNVQMSQALPAILIMAPLPSFRHGCRNPVPRTVTCRALSV